MNIKIYVFLAFVALVITACTPKQTEESQTVAAADADPNEWPEMDSFHMIMAEAFHPYKDSTNLEPVKQLAEKLAQNAEAWSATALPEKVNSDEMKAMLAQLKADTRSLADKIKAGATDEEIGTALTALHNSFHGIMETWNGGGHEEHNH